MTGPVLVELINGEIVMSDAEAWRAETEARQILAMQPLEKRRQFLADIEEKRGVAEADRIRARMTALHEARAAE